MRFSLLLRGWLALLCLLITVGASLPAAQTYSQWLNAHSLAPDSDPQASQAQDGIANFTKFGLGLDPRVAGYAGAYRLELLSVGGVGYAAITFRQPHPPQIGLRFALQASSDLGEWDDVDPIEVASVIEGGFRTLTWRDGTSAGQRFLRLNAQPVSLPVNTGLPTISGVAEVGQVLTATPGTWTDGGEPPLYAYQWLRNGAEISGATGSTYLLAAADAGAGVSVRIIATNAAGGAQAVSAATEPVVVPAPQPALRIRPDGWTADLTYPGLTTGGTYALDPDGTPKLTLTATSPGFDAQGAPTTRTRQIVGTVPLRKPYPNQSSDQQVAVEGGVQVTIALSERVYAGDTLSGCTLAAGLYTSGGTPSPAATPAPENTSTLPYPKAVANWCAPPWEAAPAGSTEFPVELLAFHRYPRDGRQVACVEFTATDQSGNSVSVKTSAMVASTRITGGNPVAVYRAGIPLAGLAQGDHVSVRAKVYPFIGDSAAILDSDPSADGEALPTLNLCNYVFLNNKTGGYGTVYAYVSPTGSASGVADSDPAVAAAAPFATIQTAAAAIKAKNNTLYGHNDLGGGVIRLQAGTYTGLGSNMNTLGAGKTWLTIEAAPGAAADAVIIQTGSAKNPGNLVKFRNLSLIPTGATTHTVIDGVSDGAVDGPPQIYGAYEGVRISGISGGNAPIIYRVGMRYFVNCEMRDLARALSGPFGATREHTPLLAGCRLTNTTPGNYGWGPSVGVGNQLSNGHYLGEGGSSARTLEPLSTIHAFNRIYGKTRAMDYGAQRPITRGMAIVQNLMEQIGNDTEPALGIGKDSSTQPLDNILVQHLTVAGSRTNFLYNDTGPAPILKSGTFQFNVMHMYNIKSDCFDKPGEGPNGARTGNWEPLHGVEQRGNVFQHPGVSNAGPPLYYGRTSWSGCYGGRNVKIVGNPAYVSDQSIFGTDTGNGDYRLGAASDARNRVPAGLAALPFDLDGVPRKNDGTGAAGAYEY